MPSPQLGGGDQDLLQGRWAGALVDCDNEVATKRDCREFVAHDDGMTGWSRVAVVAVTCALACGCSSSAKPAARTSSAPPTATSAAAVQAYLDAVNTLCDALLPKVMAVTNGGSLNVPLSQYLAQEPTHGKLLSDFDRDLARVSVPPEAAAKAAALNAYIQFANNLDAKRLAAAKQGQAAYTKEIEAEQASAATDPSIAARNAAGFHDSCDAR